MSYMKSLVSALNRSVEMARQSTVSALRMDVAPTARSEGALPLWGMASAEHIKNFATGSDSDIGGLSTCKLALDQEGKGRFFGTLSTEIPRGGKIERSGYAGFRNRNRPTLFGNQTWDTTLYPYLLLRVRNRIPSSSTLAPSASSALASTLHTPASRLDAAVASGRARDADPGNRSLHALGLGLATAEPPGPKFFINVQTDGPVTSDLFQHRLWLDPAAKDQWQDVMVPFSDFVLTNTGQVSPSQIQMMREKIRTVGISAVLATPDAPPSVRPGQVDPAEENAEGEGDVKTAGTGARGARRGASFNFDLGIEGAWAVGEDALAGAPPRSSADEDSLI